MISRTRHGREQVSLVRALSKLGLASRTEAEQLIRKGQVAVNDQVVRSPHTWLDLRSDRISIEDFMKVELRTAKVLTAERVEKSKKLLKLSVDVGTEVRTLVAGIAEAYEPDALVGKTVVIVFNLKPAKLMGIESNGMVLAASPDGGAPTVVSFDVPPPPGTRVR